MKSKIKIFLLSLIFILSAGIVGACGQKEITASFQVDGIYEMAINETAKLKDLVKVTGGEISDLTFCSSDEDVIYITPQTQTIVARNKGEAVITIANTEETLTIVVKEITAQQFEVPTNLKYNDSTKMLTWDAKYFGEAPVKEYILQISTNESEYVEHRTNKNYFKIDGYGKYKVKVACNSNEINKENLKYSNEYTFTKLTAPTNLKYNDSTKMLTWEADSSISSFYVKVNGILSEKINEKQYKLNLSNEENYEISVMSSSGGDENVFGSISADDVLTLTRLKSVEIKIVSGVVTWEDSQLNVKKYKVEVFKSNNLNSAIQTTYINRNEIGEYSFTLNSINDVNATYSIKIIALGDVDESVNIFQTNSHYLNSKVSQYDGIKKLQSATINFDKAQRKVSILSFDAEQNAKYNLYVKHNEGQPTILDISSGECVINFEDEGTYEMYVVNCAVNNEYEINSESSNKITVVKLKTAHNVTQRVNESNQYVVENVNIENAVANYLYVTHPSTLEPQLLRGNGIYGDVDDIFNLSGTYEVKIVAKGIDDIDNAIYYLDSETVLNVHRLQDVTLNDDGSKISWEKDNAFSNIIYAYKLVGEEQEIKTTNLEYIYTNKDQVGEYTFEIYETINNIGEQATLILNSLKKSQKQFVITKPIGELDIKLTRDNGEYYLEIIKDEKADTYSIYCNNILINIIEKPTENIKYNVSSCFNVAGIGENLQEYTFKIHAKNSENKYYIESVNNVIKAEKVNVPIEILIDTNEKISATSSEKWFEKSLIVIDDNETDVLNNQKTQQNIKVKFVAKSNLINGKYYLDSDFVEFKVKRDTSNVSFLNNKIVWSTEEASQTLTRKLVIEQNDKTAEIKFTNNENEITVNSLKQKISSFVFDIDANFSATIQYVLGEEKFALKGDYVDGAFESSDENTFYVSSATATINVVSPTEELSLEIIENEEEVKIAWVSTSGDKFVVYNNNNASEIIMGNNDEFNYILKRSEINTNIIVLEKIEDIKTAYVFSIAKLSKISGVEINKNEELTAKEIDNGSIIFLLDGEEVTSLKNVSIVQKTVIAYYKANKVEKTSKHYFINGDKQEYMFVRLSQTEIVFENNIMRWITNDLEVNAKYDYILTFSDSDATTEDKTVKLDSSVNNINLNDETYQKIIHYLGNSKVVKIGKEVNLFGSGNSYKLDKNSLNYLTSIESELYSIKVLNTPINVSIVAIDDDKYQSSIKVQWDIDEIESTTINAYNLKIINGKSETVITTPTNTKEYIFTGENNFFKAVGEWKISVQAVGANGSLSSEFSSQATITRLNESNVLNVSNDGLIKWSKNEYASKYILEYNYTTNLGLVEKTYITTDNLITSYQIPQEILNQEFFGEINTTLYTVGNKVNYLSNNKTTQFSRLEKPEITFAEEYIVIENYENYVSETKFNITAKINNEEIFKVNIVPDKLKDGRYVWYYPIEQFLANEDIEISIFATKETGNYINSNVNNGTVVLLNKISNLHFIKENGITYFCADNVNTINSYIINLDGEEIIDSGSKIKIEINEDVLKTIATNWTIKVKATGTLSDKMYISSEFSSLTGKKLNAVSGIKTENGVITWNEMSNASAFVMQVEGVQLDKTYAPNVRSEKLEGYLAGSYNIQVKAIGNVGTTAMSTNIILDSNYSNNVNITKLNQIENINVNKGFFTFDEVANATEYTAYVYKYSTAGESFIGEYKLSEVKLPIESTTVFYSGNLTINVIDKTPLNAGEEIRAKFYAKTSNENFIYSDFAKISVDGIEDDYLILKTVKNVNNKVTISHPNILGKDELDFSLTYINWEHNNEVVDSDYLISINTEKQIVNNGTTSLLLDAFYDDPEKAWESGKPYEIRYKQLGSNGINDDRVVYLTPAFSDAIIVEKLPSVTIEMYTKTSSPYGSYLTFDKIENADKYYCYLDGNLYAEHQSSISEMNLSNLLSGIYNNFKARAISTKQEGEITYIASGYSIPYYNETPIERFKKLNAPEQVSVIDGAICWTFTDGQMMEVTIKGYTDAPVYVDPVIIETQKVEILLTAKNGAQYKFLDDLYKYLYLTDEQIAFAKQHKEDIDERLYNLVIANKQKGYPSLDYYFTEFGTSLPAGEYSLQMRLVGEHLLLNKDTGTMLFSSDYSKKTTKYISTAPTIIAENKQLNKDDQIGNYYIKLSNVQVDGNFFTSNTPKYNLVGISYDEDGKEVREILSSVNATGINNSEEIIFDVTDLINQGIITSKHKQLFVYISGDDEQILNGRPSNKINISVLNPITARVDHGVIKWDSQDLATKYIINYGTGIKIVTLDEMINEDSLTYFEWLGTELNAENSTGYEVSIIAFGSPLNTESKTDIIISGAETSIGTVVRLPLITTEVNGINIINGLYSWNKINNASGYDVFISNEEGNIPEQYKTIYAVDYDDVITYETTVTKINEEIVSNYYYFRTVGTEEGELFEYSTTYINSDISNYNRGKRLQGISELKMLNGIISWNPVDNQNLFKLTFKKVESSNVLGENIIVNLNYDDIKTSTGSCMFNTNVDDRLDAYGSYVVQIQSYRTGKVLVNGEEIETYYLISEPEQLQFYKLREVKDIRVTGGIISWEYADIDGVNAEHYYELVFTNKENSIITTTTKFVEIEEYKDIVFDDEAMANKPLELKIYVIPGRLNEESTINYAISKPTSYASIYQYATIEEETINVTVTGAGQIKIDWAGPDDKVGYDPTVDENVKYEIYYYKKGDINSAKTYQVENRSYVLCGYGDGFDIAFDISAESAIIFKIRRIPVKDNYISSAWTVEKEISQPNAIENLRVEGYDVVWDKYNVETLNSYQYKIKDEFITMDESGNEITNVYIFTANIGDEIYTPYIIGKHKISVAVVNLTSNLISSYVDLESEIDFNIFESGDGSVVNPYIVSSSQQFNNMKYRLNKDAKLNSYYRGKVVDGKLDIDEEKNKVELSDGDLIFNFKQIGNLIITRKDMLNKSKVSENYVFNGNYNGNYNAITLDMFNVEGLESYEKSYISLFDKIGNKGSVINLNLLLNLSGVIGKSISTISALCYENAGTISNIAIGEVKENRTLLQMTGLTHIVFTFIAYSNNGTIKMVQNYYNIKLSTNENNPYAIQFATVTLINNKEVSQCKNLGNIEVSAAIINVSGIVGKLSSGATVSESANSGNLKLYYNRRGASESYIGGIISQNTNGIIKSCYTACDITISYNMVEFSGESPKAYAGGIIGHSTGDNITDSYVNVTKNMNTNGGLDAIYQAIGLLTAVTASSGTKLYYKAGDVGAYAGQNTVSKIEFIAYDIMDVNDLSDKYSLTVLEEDQGNPHLVWEDTFRAFVWPTIEK